MTSQPRPFVVEHIKRRSNYESKAGDPRRSGKAEVPLPPRDDPPRTATEAAVEFRVMDSGLEYAIIGKGAVHVATLRPENHPRAKASFWFDLPYLPRTPQLCGDMDKARNAVRFKVAQWFDATDHVLSAASQVRLRKTGGQ